MGSNKVILHMIKPFIFDETRELTLHTLSPNITHNTLI